MVINCYHCFVLSSITNDKTLKITKICFLKHFVPIPDITEHFGSNILSCHLPYVCQVSDMPLLHSLRHCRRRKKQGLIFLVQK